MKYHYMRISSSSVRIELFPENNAEKILLQRLAQAEKEDAELKALYENALSNYSPGARLILTGRNYMAFPQVAICSYQTEKESVHP